MVCLIKQEHRKAGQYTPVAFFLLILIPSVANIALLRYYMVNVYGKRSLLIGTAVEPR